MCHKLCLFEKQKNRRTFGGWVPLAAFGSASAFLSPKVTQVTQTTL